LPPAARFQAGVGISFNVNLIPARSFCFVPEAHFTEPIRSTTVIVNNTTIINKTVNITKITVVNNTVINTGPPAARIEQATGRPVQVVRAAELRQQVETKVAIKPAQRSARQTTVEARPNQPKPRPLEKPVVATREERPVEKAKPAQRPEEVAKAKEAVEKPKPQARPEQQRPETAKAKPNEKPGQKPPAKKPAPKKEEKPPEEKKPEPQ
jgi:hypothetical protein